MSKPPGLSRPDTPGHNGGLVSVPWRWLVVLAPALLLYVLPLPGLTPPQRHLLAIFAATVIGLVAQPVSMGATAMIVLPLLAVTKTLSTAQVFSGFANPTVWLIFTAF